MVSQAGNERQAPSLPPLRDDLQLFPGHSDWTGAPSMLIHDPLRNRYFRIGSTAMALIASWQPIPAPRLARSINVATGEATTVEEVEALGSFLMANGLTTGTNPGKWRELSEQAKAVDKPLWHRLVHNYLFFRIPLFRPQRFLDLLWPTVAPLFTRAFAASMGVLGVLSLYLVSRQWNVFTATFTGFLSVEGLLFYGVSLVLIKMIHELGHAFMARKHGVEVPVVGIAFILLMPILYTDTTGAYRLRRRSEKLNIDLAGIYAELVLAVIATTTWVFLPDGPLRSIAFSTATLSWAMSLAVNLNPFMRFDGYYVLSDAIGFENLQERGFALAKWRLREILFGLKRPAPEFLPAHWRCAIILHAWGTWIYRFFLFLGIALLVYHFFIKIIGIALFVIEICWFILLPVWRELKVWWESRRDIAMQRRSRTTLIGILLLAGLFVAPVFGTVQLPAVLRAADTVALHPLHSAVVIENNLKNERQVLRGEILVRLASPDLEIERLRHSAEMQMVETRLARMPADGEDQSLRLVLEQELAAAKKRADGLMQLENQLEMRAPRTGVLVNVDHELHEGMWVGPETRLALLKPSGDIEVLAFVDEHSVARLGKDASGVFIPDDFQLQPFPVTIRQVGKAASRDLPEPVLAQTHGGRIPVLPASNSSREAFLPDGAWYPVRLHPVAKLSADYSRSILRGVVRVQAERESMATRTFRRVAGVLLRESGF